MVNKISELSVRDLPDHIKENINDLIRSFSDMDGLIQVFWIQYGLKNVMNYSVVSLKPSYAVRYEDSFPYYQNKKATSSGTRYFYQGDSDWSKLDSLYKELMREEKLNKLGI